MTVLVAENLLKVFVDLIFDDSFFEFVLQVHLHQIFKHFVEPKVIVSLEFVDCEVEFLQNPLLAREIQPDAFLSVNLLKSQVELPEGFIRDVALALLIHFLPLFDQLQDHALVDDRLLVLPDFGVGVDDQGDEGGEQEHAEQEVKGAEEQEGQPRVSAAVLPVSLELLVVGDGEADEVGLEGLGGVLDLLDGRLHGRELYQCQQRIYERLVILVEGIDFVVVLEEAEHFHPDDAVDEEGDGQDHE